MNAKINFIMGVHCHQPVGNFGWVYESAFKECYLPFIEVLERHPGLKMTVHYTGSLIDWILSNQPSFLSRIRKLVESGQVEMMGGAYYEAILPIIPEEDATGQIKLMSGVVEEYTGYRPVGFWLAERVWEPHLPSLLNKNGIKYTVVDDRHFLNAGLSQEQCLGYYITEEQGKKISVFSTSERLRYQVPFRPPQETISFLRSIASDREERVVVIADDGEKFGVWPGTHKWVYQQGWLDKFFTLLEENQSWIKTTTFSEFIQRVNPKGRIYLPAASYTEMMEWSGGFFRNFLVKYPESNNMHKRMLMVSRKVRQQETADAAVFEICPAVLEQARKHLYQAQCNCAYWHGVFGGLYLHHLRQSIYSHLIEAENLIEGIQDTDEKLPVSAEVFDFDADGYDEVLLKNNNWNLFFDGPDGGSLFELDDRKQRINLVNTLTRLQEHYHDKLTKPKRTRHQPRRHIESIHEIVGLKEPGLDKYLKYDRYRKVSFLDHLLPVNFTREHFVDGLRGELADCPLSPYGHRILKEPDRTGIEFTRGGEWHITKTFWLNGQDRGISFEYRVENHQSKTGQVLFGIEFNFSLKDESLERVNYQEKNKSWLLKDKWFGLAISFEFDQDCYLWTFPLETVSESESGLERTYQGLSLLFYWPINFKSSEVWQQKGRLIISHEEAEKIKH